MKKNVLLAAISCLWLTPKLSGQTDQQDTVKVYINKKRTDNDGKTHLWYSKIENGKIMDGRKDTLFYSVCDCPKSRKLPEQGDTSKILRRDMIYMDNKVTWRKVNN